MSEEIKNTLDVECPHCNEENTVKFSKDLKCKNCDKSIMGTTNIYKTNKTSLLVTALASASVAAVLADKNVAAHEIILLVGSSAGTLIYVSRLKIETEYKMMKTCIDRFGTNTVARDTCFCAVKKLSTYLNAQIAKLKGEVWLSDQLDNQYTKCEDTKLVSNQTKK